MTTAWTDPGEAEAILAEAGFRKSRGVAMPSSGGTIACAVYDQSPEAGTVTGLNTTITYYYYEDDGGC